MSILKAIDPAITTGKTKQLFDAPNMAVPGSRFDARKAIIWGGLVAGVLDAINGVVAFGLKGMNPIQVLQYIASGLLGPASR